MSVRETPKSNRYLDLKEKERAYRKHMEAVANAKPTIDTSTPDCPNRLRVKEKADAHYRRQLLSDYSKRERMIASAREGKRNQDIFPDDYNPDDDEIDFDELVKKYGGDIYQENPEPKEPPPVKTPEKSPQKTEKIHFGDGKVKIEEEDAEEITKNLDDLLNDNIDDLTSKKSPSKEKGSPSQKSRASSKIPVPRKSNSSSKKEEKSKKKKEDKTNKSSQKEEKTDKSPQKEEKTNKSSQKVEKTNKSSQKIDTKSGLLGSSISGKDSFSSSAKKKTLQNTASSTMSFGDDFEDDFENDQSTEEEKSNFEEPASESESTNKFEEEKNESDDSKSSSSSDSDDDAKKKSLSLDETNSSELDKTEPMSNPIAKLAEDKNSDDMPELDFPDF